MKKDTGKIVNVTETVSSGAAPSGRVARQSVLIGQILKEARKRKKLTQDGLASILGVSKFSVRNWEVDANKPDYDFIPILCSLLDIPIQDLFGISSDYSEDEKEIIRQYRDLSPVSKEIAKRMISSILEVEQEKSANGGMTASTEEETLQKEAYRIIEQIPGGVAAGTGHDVPEYPVSPFFIPNSKDFSRADGVIRVYGHSMEPRYEDGDLVLFEYTDGAGAGDDVVAKWAEGAIVKHLDESGNLLSLNPDYPFEYTGGEEGVQIIGRVVGVLSQEDIPDKRKETILYDLFSDEIHEFHEEHGNT